MENLTIYKASAGSGKTYRLVREYLLLLLKNPYNFRHILAVTFTNKATAEMKGKVINELFLLSKADSKNAKSEHRQAIKAAYPMMSDADIMKKAAHILSLILNNYSHFFISTIDKFFQYIIKSFSKELGIFNNYNLQLDNDSILSEAVEQLFMNLEDEDQSALLTWLTSYAESRVEDGDKYDITGNIINLGKELFKEGFKTEKQAFFEILEDREKMMDLLKDIKKRIRDLENEFVAFGKRGLDMIENFGLTVSDFKHGTRSGMTVFNKLKTRKIDDKLISSYTLKMAEDDNEWVTSKSKFVYEVDTARDNGLRDLLTEFLGFYDDNYETLQSLKAVSKNFYTLGIFVDLQKAIKSYTEEHKLLLLSDSNELINAIIGDNDTPFIYEKAGNAFGYFMIDEFQDTSNMQWRNFKPLISNSLAFGHPNLLVGDVKQSIYRWRNSDWQLLASEIYNEFSNQQISKHVLGDNWRSAEHIVGFNNFIFDKAPEILQAALNSAFPSENIAWKSMIKHAYEGQKQIAMHKDGKGYVYYRNFGKKDEFELSDVYMLTIEKIEDAQLRGFKAGDIAVLVRKNKEGADFIKFLLQYKQSDEAKAGLVYDVISSDSLVLGASEVLVFIMNLLKLETEPENLLLVSEINYFIHACKTEEIKQHFNPMDGGQVVLDTGIAEKLKGLELLSLKEKTDAIVQSFKLDDDPQQCIFIEAFRDILNEYIKRFSSDIYGFIKHWEDIKNKTSVQAPKTDNAIQVMTIHKAKGLEFPIVILPFANWKMDIDKVNIAWCKVPEKLGIPLPVVPVQLTSSLKETVFKDTLTEEQLLTSVDNLNLLYVAMTRAKTELYIFGSLEKKNTASTLLDACLDNATDSLAYETLDDGSIVYGSKSSISESTGSAQSGNIQFKGIHAQSKSKPIIRRKAPRVFSSSDSDIMERAHIGTFLHEAFSQSAGLADILINLDKQVREGNITAEEGEQLKAIVSDKFRQAPVDEWFNTAYKSLNEITIREGDREWRPDKVILKGQAVEVIDYKFGIHEDPRYVLQVSAYKNVLKRMGYQNVKGFLWFVALDKIVKV